MAPELTSPWIRISMDQWESLLKDRSPTVYQKNSLIYHQGDEAGAVFIVLSGRVRVTAYQENGGEKQLYIAERGALFGLTACFNQHARSSSAVAIVDSSIYTIPFAELEQAMQADWALCHRVIELLCRKNTVFFKQVVDLSFSDALQRITQVLLNLAEEYGTPVGNGVLISIRFTHQDVANITNTSRVTVSNVFNALIAKGFLEKQSGHFLLHSPELLRKMINQGDTNK